MTTSAPSLRMKKTTFSVRAEGLAVRSRLSRCLKCRLLLVGGTNHTISDTTVGGRGFTAIMVSWLAKFNPIFMVFTSFLIVFLEKGSEQISTDFRIPSAISDIITGIILLFIIGCEFFLQYKIAISKSGKEND